MPYEPYTPQSVNKSRRGAIHGGTNLGQWVGSEGIITVERPIDISNVVKLSDAKVEKKVEKKEETKKTVKEEKPKTKSKEPRQCSTNLKLAVFLQKADNR